MHVVIGAGSIGTRVARLLAERGEQVRLISRSGRGPSASNIELVAADASQGLVEHTEGAETIYNCVNPAYTRWLVDFPPLAAAILEAAKTHGAVLAAVNNLYGYGPVDGPITHGTRFATTAHPKLRLRARMWEDALASGVRVTEVRASDYLGAGDQSVLEELVLKHALQGKTAYAIGDPDAPHSWTSVDDTARTLVTIAGDERALGRGWLVPTPPPLSVRAIANRTNELVGLPPAKVARMPYWMLWTAGVFVPMIKEVRATYYQFAKPFVVDSSVTEATFGLAPTPLDETLTGIAAIYRDR